MAATTPTAIKGTSITQPTADPANHKIVLGQLKETTEIAQRQRGDPNDSFVRVSELLNVTGATLINGTIQPPAATTSSSTGGTVSVQDSITGTGAAGSPLQLSGDNASPGNSMLYGTNSSGAKGWYAQPSGSGGSTPTPETVPNLVYWFDASIVNSNAGGYVPCLQNSAPGHESNSPFSQVTPAIGTIAATQLNGKNVLSVPSSNTSSYNIYYGALWLAQCTFFAVWNSPSFSGTPSLIASESTYSGGFQYFINASGHAQVSKCFVALQAADSVKTFSTNTWYQSNVTYDSAGGNVSFRASRTAGSTATGQAALTNLSTGLLGIPGYGSQCWNGSVAEILAYDRVLTLAEIETIENYLYAKWGV